MPTIILKPDIYYTEHMVHMVVDVVTIGNIVGNCHSIKYSNCTLVLFLGLITPLPVTTSDMQ